VGNRVRGVLDYGEVELVQACGDDLTPVAAARTSYAGRNGDEGRDRKLLRYLATNGHYGPFEFIDATWRVKAPLFVARQWMRHRTGSYNEFSFRYAEPTKLNDEDEIHYYTPRLWRSQHNVDRQLSGEARDNEVGYQRQMQTAILAYRTAIAGGVSREQARLYLPSSVYTQFWYKTNMRNLLHFLSLRLDSHAQEETRQFAEAISEDVKENWPLVWELFEEGLFV